MDTKGPFIDFSSMLGNKWFLKQSVQFWFSVNCTAMSSERLGLRYSKNCYYSIRYIIIN